MAGRTHALVELVPKSKPILMRGTRTPATGHRSAGGGRGAAERPCACAGVGAVGAVTEVECEVPGLEAFGAGDTVDRPVLGDDAERAFAVTGCDVLCCDRCCTAF